MQFTFDSPSACRCPHNMLSKVYPGFDICLNTSECDNCQYFVLKDFMAKTVECSFTKKSASKLELFLSGVVGLRSSYKDNADKVVEFLDENNIKFDFEGLYGTKSNYITFVSRDRIDGFKRATTCTEDYWFSKFNMDDHEICDLKDLFTRPKIKPIYLGI